MHTTPYFHATAIPNVRPENLVQIGIGGWQARRAPRGARSLHTIHTRTVLTASLSCAPSQVPRAAVPIMRDRRTNIFSVADVEDLGPDKVGSREGASSAAPRDAPPRSHAPHFPSCPSIGDRDGARPRVGRDGRRVHELRHRLHRGARLAPSRVLCAASNLDAAPHPASPSIAQAGFVPGTGWPEPGGFLPREALKMVGLVAAEGLCGMEIVEVRAQHATPTGEKPATRRRRPLSHTTNASLPSLCRAGEPAVRPRRHHVADGAPRLRRRPRLDGGARQDGAPQEHHRQAVRALLIFPTTAPVTCMPSLLALSHHTTGVTRDWPLPFSFFRLNVSNCSQTPPCFGRHDPNCARRRQMSRRIHLRQASEYMCRLKIARTADAAPLRAPESPAPPLIAFAHTHPTTRE